MSLVPVRSHMFVCIPPVCVTIPRWSNPTFVWISWRSVFLTVRFLDGQIPPMNFGHNPSYKASSMYINPLGSSPNTSIILSLSCLVVYQHKTIYILRECDLYLPFFLLILLSITSPYSVFSFSGLQISIPFSTAAHQVSLLLFTRLSLICAW